MPSSWSALGLPGEPLTPGIELMAKYVQWAMYGVEQGIMQQSGNWYFEPDWSDVLTGQWWRRPVNLDEVKYNLDVFDQLKTPSLQYAQDEATRRQVYRLIVTAEGLRYAIQRDLIATASPSMWSYFRAFILGGKPAFPTTPAMAAEAKRAALAAAEAASVAGLPDLVAYYEDKAANTGQLVRDAEEFWSEPGQLRAIQAPSWIWIVAAGLGAYLIYKVTA